jgi:hypothetical protein
MMVLVFYMSHLFTIQRDSDREVPGTDMERPEIEVLGRDIDYDEVALDQVAGKCHHFFRADFVCTGTLQLIIAPYVVLGSLSTAFPAVRCPISLAIREIDTALAQGILKLGLLTSAQIERSQVVYCAMIPSPGLDCEHFVCH